MRRNGSICGVLALFVMAASAAAQEGPMRVTYDRNNIIRVNGKPFLPIAVWAQPEDTFAMWKDLGVNLFITGEHPRKGGTLEAYVKACEEHNVYMSLGYHWLRSEGKLEELNRHPLLFTLHHPDEPDKPAGAADAEGGDTPRVNPRISPEQIIADYQAVKKLDPERLVSMTLMARFMDEVTFRSISKEQYKAFMPGSDLIMYDLYPVSIWGRHLHWNAEGLKQLRRLAGPNKPIGIWLQASDAMSDTDPGMTGEQIRANAWMALINGATFIGYFPQTFKSGFKFHDINQQRRDALKAVNREVTELADVILTAPRNDLFELRYQGARVDAMQRLSDSGDRALLVLVNVIEEGEGRPVTVSVTPRAFKAAGVPALYGSTQPLPLKDGAWQVELQPWQTAVIVVDAAR